MYTLTRICWKCTAATQAIYSRRYTIKAPFSVSRGSGPKTDLSVEEALSSSDLTVAESFKGDIGSAYGYIASEMPLTIPTPSQHNGPDRPELNLVWVFFLGWVGGIEGGILEAYDLTMGLLGGLCLDP